MPGEERSGRGHDIDIAEGMEHMRIVAMCGSARAGGNTATLIDAMLEGAAEAGATVTKCDLPKLDIRPCQACDQCLKSADATCVQNDDMARILGELRDADAWILGTPIYYGHLSGSLKTAIDRMYSLWTTEGGWQLGFRGPRRGAVVVVQMDSDPGTPKQVAEYLESILQAHNAEVVGRLAEPSLGAPGDAAARPDLLTRAREIGRKLVGASLA